MTDWPDREVNSLQLSISVDFDPADMTFDEFEGLPLLTLEGVTLNILLRLLDAISKRVHKDEDLEGLADVAVEGFFGQSVIELVKTQLFHVDVTGVQHVFCKDCENCQHPFLHDVEIE